jgi:hypothetical protein
MFFNGYEAIMRLLFIDIYYFNVFMSSQARFIAFCKWYADDGFIGNEFVFIAVLFLTDGEAFCFTKKRFGFNIQTACSF